MKDQINAIIKKFHANSISPQIGFELEFYITSQGSQIFDKELIEDFINNLNSKLFQSKLKNNFLAKKEQGNGQIEIKTNPSLDIELLVQELDIVKVISKEISMQNSFEISFNPAPFLKDCSNALQINLSILNKNKENLFDKKNDKESQILLKTISILLDNIENNINHFSSKKESKRFDIKRNIELFKNGKFTSPVNLSWGYDNRSCAIRIVGKDNNRRLEFRVPDANIDIGMATIKFLEIVCLVIEENNSTEEIIKPIYGNAFDQNYAQLTSIK